MQGNDRLRVGGVVSQGEDTYVVDIVTVDDFWSCKPKSTATQSGVLRKFPVKQGHPIIR